MSLISVQRSPSPDSGQIEDAAEVDGDACFVAESDSESITGNSSQPVRTAASSTTAAGKGRALSECYFFAVKGAAFILSHSEQSIAGSPRASSASASELEVHLHSMCKILRSDHTLTMAVRLQCSREGHARYISLVTTTDPASEMHEAVLFGFDFLSEGKVTIGITVPLLSSTRVELDGDGGIRVRAFTTSTLHLFKPISIQAMWSLFQVLHREVQIATAQTSSKVSLYLHPGMMSHHWVKHYRQYETEDDAIIAQWHHSIVDDAALGDLKASLEGRDDVKSKEQMENEALIRINLLQIMQSVDLDEVTSKDIRSRLEEQMGRGLSAYKEFIDQEMLLILGRLDKPSQIFEYLYLGTEWNASNWDELRDNNVGYILNVTNEVDCFFPAHFKYLKILVSDEANTELLMYWQCTYDFIREAKDKKSNVLVHCKKGISRSSSTVIAYIMKEYGWSLERSLQHVKDKRNCITPNSGFMEQLETFHGVLQASNNRHSAVFNIASNPSTASFASSCSSTSYQLTLPECSKAKPKSREVSADPPLPVEKEGKKPKKAETSPSKQASNRRPPTPSTTPTAVVKSPVQAVVSSEVEGKRRQSASTLVDSGKVKLHRSYFESKVKGKPKSKGTQATSLVGSIAKSLGRLSLINPRLGDSEWKKAHQQVTASNKHSFISRRSHFDQISSGHDNQQRDEKGNIVKSLVNAFETKGGGIEGDLAKEKKTLVL